jgi:hypothetical protein
MKFSRDVVRAKLALQLLPDIQDSRLGSHIHKYELAMQKQNA